MISHMRGQTLKNFRAILMLGAIFSLALQPAYLFLLSVSVHAETVPATVVINEVAPASDSANKWVELYNPTEAPLDISGWRVMRESAQFGVAIADNTLLASHGFYVVESTNDGLPLNSTAAVELWNGPSSTGSKIDTFTYPGLEAGQSYGRTTDGDTTFATFMIPTKGLPNIAGPDIKAPSVPTGGAPNGIFETTHDFYFTWNAATDDRSAQISYEFQYSATDAVDGSGSLTGAWNSIADGNSEQHHLADPEIHFTALQDGTYYWQVRAIDGAGNKSAWSSTWNTTVDTIHPTLTISQPSEGETFGGSGKEKITVQSYLEDSNGLAQYHIDIDGRDPEAQDENTSNLQAAPASLTVLAIFNASDFSNGQHTINVRVTDKAGNSTTVSRIVNIDNPVVVPDPPAPVVTIDDETQGRTVTGTVSDPNAVFSVKIDGVLQNDIPVRIGALTADGYAWSLTVPAGIISGVEHIIEVTASANGKSSVAESSFTLPTDTTVPGSGEGYIPDASDLLPGQLSENLRQPFVVPDTFGAVPFAPSDTKTATADTLGSALLGVQTTKDPSADQNVKTVAVTATEGGWKLFGLYWYWWVLLIGSFAVVTTWLKLRARRRMAVDMDQTGFLS